MQLSSGMYIQWDDMDAACAPCTDAWTTDMDASGCCWSNHTISHVTNQPLVTTKKQAIESGANKLTAWLTSVQCSHMCVKKIDCKSMIIPYVHTRVRTRAGACTRAPRPKSKKEKRRAIVKSARVLQQYMQLCKGENSTLPLSMQMTLS